MHRPSACPIVAAASSFLALGLLGCAAEEPRNVAVGVAVPYMGGGLMLEARQAWQMVVDEVNAAGGIGGKTLDVHERELPLSNASDLSPLADGFAELADEGHRYIISLISGAALAPMMDEAVARGVLAMSVTSEDPAAGMPEFDGLLLRAILPTDRLIEKQASTLQAEGLRSIAVVGETVMGETDLRQRTMQDAYARCSGCRAVSVTYPVEADLYRYDWESVGRDVMAARPDVVYLASADVSALLDTIFWIERGGYAGLYYFAHGAFMANVSAAMPGSKTPLRFRSQDLALPPSERLDAFLTAYEARYGDHLVPEPRLIAFADYLSLLSLALIRVGDDDPRAVSAAMKELARPPGESHGTLDFAAAAQAVRAGRDIDFVGLSGPLDFDARGEVSDGFVQEYAVTPSGDIAPLP